MPPICSARNVTVFFLYALRLSSCELTFKDEVVLNAPFLLRGRIVTDVRKVIMQRLPYISCQLILGLRKNSSAHKGTHNSTEV
jgi:hypothetical protein